MFKLVRKVCICAACMVLGGLLVFAIGCGKSTVSVNSSTLPEAGGDITASELAMVLGVSYCDLEIPSGMVFNQVDFYKKEYGKEPVRFGQSRFSAKSTRLRFYFKRSQGGELTLAFRNNSTGGSYYLVNDSNIKSLSSSSGMVKPGEFLLRYTSLSEGTVGRRTTALNPGETGIYCELSFVEKID